MTATDNDMRGKICLITGATSGIGKVTALTLAQMGAQVTIVARNAARGEAARREIQDQSGNATVELLLADLASLAAVRHLAEEFQQRHTQLHVLINNAGVFTLRRRQETADGLEMMFAVNCLAPFLLTNLLLPLLKASAPARIVNVDSNAHESGYIKMDDLQAKQRYRSMQIYGQSKLAMMLWTYELTRMLEDTGVTANCLHPGFVATNIAQSDLGPILRPLAKLVVSRFGISPQKGAQTSIYLASSPEVENVTGKYFVDCKPKESVSISHDETLQRQLWDACQSLVQATEKA